MSNKCPICKHDNPPDKELCDNCKWYIPLQSDNFIQDQARKFGLRTLKNIENWGRRVWDRLERYKRRIEELEKQNSIINQQTLPKLQEDFTTLSAGLDSKIELKINDSRPSLENYIREQVNLQIEDKIGKIINLEREQENLKIKIDGLEKQLSATNKKRDDKLEPEAEIATSDSPQLLPVDSSNNSSKSVEQLSEEEKWVVDCYRQDSSQLLKYADNVSITEKTVNEIWKSKADQIIFEESFDQNEYWLFRLQDSVNIYLVPAHNLRINTNVKVVQNIFKLKDFSKSGGQNEYSLIKPARVINFAGDKWKLIETGILQF